MDLADRLGNFSLGPWLSKRIPALSRDPSDPKRTLRFRRGLAGIALLAIGAGLAYWAQTLSGEMAVRDWEKSHPPAELIWRHALGSRDFRLLADPEQMQKASRKLPMRIDSERSVWISPDSRWVAIFLDPERSLPEQIYCWKCAPPFPASWEPIGEGWAGFNSVLQRLDATAATRHKVENRRRSSEFADPREIHY